MDGLSGVSSAFAVVSLAIQLADGINKLCSLLNQINGAPQELKSLQAELDFCSQVLDEIKHNEQVFGPHPTTKLALERCVEPIGALNSMADSFAPGLMSESKVKQKWTALEAVRKGDQIAKIKAKLQEAKINLLMAQQSAAIRTSYHFHRSHQESLTGLTRSIADLYTDSPLQSTNVTSCFQGEASPILDDLSSEIFRVSSSWPVKSMQNQLQAELSRAINATVKGVLQDQVSSTMASKALQSWRPQVQTSKMRKLLRSCSSVTRTMFGDVRCTVTPYRVTMCSQSDMEDDTESLAEEQLEIQTRFTFVPSWWMSKFGMAAFQFDMIKLCSQGWQTNMRTFNLVPKDSPIQKYCYEGNVEAVKRLLIRKEASVNDIFEDGQTPLHVAANRGHADVCALLLQHRADPTVREPSSFKRTPFACACLPGEIVDDGSLYSSESVSQVPYTQTIQVFVRAGEEFSDIHQDRILDSLIFVEGNGRMIGEGSELPSMWLLHDILPAVNPYILDEDCWLECLQSTLRVKPGHPSIAEFISRCDTKAVRSAFMNWIYNEHNYGPLNDNMLKDFQLLVENSGGICFVQPYYEILKSPFSVGWTESFAESPISLAMRQPSTFSKLRVALERSSYDIDDIVRTEIDTFSNGWTVERMLPLFTDASTPRYKRCYFHCRVCNNSGYYPYLDTAWERKIRRCKAGIDEDLPLNPEESRLQKEWDDAVRYCDDEICMKCQGKDPEHTEEEESSPFLLDL